MSTHPIIGPTMEYATSRPLEARGSLIQTGTRFGADMILSLLTRGAALIVMLMLAALVAVMLHASLPAIETFRAKFLVTSDWRPNSLEIPKKDKAGNVIIDEDGNTVMQTIPPAFGALPVIFGTAMSSVLALIFAVPLSLGTALFLVRIAPKVLAGPVSFLVEFLAAIPSIAYGMWGLFVLAPFLQNHIESWMATIYAALGKPEALHWLFQESTPLVNGTVLVRDIAMTGRDMFCGGLVLAIMILPIITA
ncbi:MAG TPA: hypothetical protein VN541_03230, partial [Tepidisphaeraceae bacterium]|nr:hypothetical protein [Tepidisphaeraceae bacterium]